MIPALFGSVLSGLTLSIASATAALRAVGLAYGFAVLRPGLWASTGAVAFPSVLIVAPVARRLVAWATRPAGGSPRG